MFLPIGDTPNPKNYTAWINWLLIAANVGVYLLITLPLSMQPVDVKDPLLIEYLKLYSDYIHSQRDVLQIVSSLSAYDLFVYQWGYRPAEPQLMTIFSSMFLHGGLVHLGGNMLFLWIFGDNVEHRLGRLLYLVVYLLTGIVATLAFAAFAGDSNTPLVGASGAISGVLGLYFLLFKRNKVKVFIFLFPIVFDVWLIPVRWVLGFYVIIDNLLPFVLSQESSVAYGAHLGGFVAGLAIAAAGEQVAWRWPRSERKTKRPKPKTAAGQSGAVDPFDELQQSLTVGDQHRAIHALNQLDRRQLAALSPRQCARLAAWLRQEGMIITAHQLLKRCVASHQSSTELAEVFLEFGLANLERGQPTAAYQHLQSVFDYDPDPQTEARARAALAQINVYQRKQRKG